jgi:aminoglycoside phosphotransferase (APT) family kinase protein
VRAVGPLLASGRECDVFEYGVGLVLRRARDGRSMAAEARTMDYARQHGIPVPEVVEVSDDGADLVMERLDGPTMVAALSNAPWTVRRQGARLGELHRQLHEIPAPEFLPAAPVGQGDRLLHLDLHPLNVMLTARGPIVIDWTNAAHGNPAVDVALAWVLLSAGGIPGRGPRPWLIGLGRGLLVKSFLAQVDVDEVGSHLREVVDWKVRDTNISADEQAGMLRLVANVEAGS